MKRHICIILVFLIFSVSMVQGKIKPAFVNTISKVGPARVSPNCGAMRSPDVKACLTCHTDVDTTYIEGLTLGCRECPEVLLSADEILGQINLELEVVPVDDLTYMVRGSVKPGICDPAYVMLFMIYKSTDKWETRTTEVGKLLFGPPNPSFVTPNIYNYSDVDNQFKLYVQSCTGCVAMCAHSKYEMWSDPLIPNFECVVTVLEDLSADPPYSYKIDPWNVNSDYDILLSKINYTLPNDAGAYDYVKIKYERAIDNELVYSYNETNPVPLLADHFWSGKYLLQDDPRNGEPVPPGDYVAIVSIDDWKDVAGDKMITVAGLDLSLEGVDEDKEETPGGFIPINENNNNGNLRRVSINNIFNIGKIVLKAENRRDKIVLWNNSEKNGFPVTLPKEWTDISVFSAEFWAEGVMSSNSSDDTEILSLEYYEVVGPIAGASNMALAQGEKKLQEDKVKITVGGVEKIKYKIGPDSYKDIPSVIYVPKGTTVDFQAFPKPSTAVWPGEKPVWGGISGASGTGETIPVTFNDVSTSSMDYKTVTAEFGNIETAQVIVVGVKQIASGGIVSTTDTAGADETLYVARALGKKITIVATMEPNAGTWPRITPVWTGATGTGFSATLPIDNASLTDEGTIVTATCGTSVIKMKVVVVGVEEKSIKFTSDHGLLTDNNLDWTDAGTIYSEPEWIVASTTNNPISHTMNTKLTVDITVKVEPSGIAFDLIGDGPDNYVDFTKTGNVSTGSDQELTITANEALPNQVGTLTKSINWIVKLTAPDPDIEKAVGSSGPHKIYVTYGTPSGSSVVTEMRMIWACTTCNGESTESGIADKIYNDFETPPPNFQLTNPNIPNPLWLLMEGIQYQGQCIHLAYLMKFAVELNGGTASIGYVYGSSDMDCYSASATDFETRICGNILSGPDGIANTSKIGDDVQVIPTNKGEPNTTAITAGVNSVLDTVPAGDDIIIGNTITTGPDGICNTGKSGDDVQEIQVGKGKSNTVIITAGPDINLQTTQDGDDVFSGHGQEEISVWSAGDWNNWEAICKVGNVCYAIQVDKGTAIEVLRNWLGVNQLTGNYQAWVYYNYTLGGWDACADPGPCPVPKP